MSQPAGAAILVTTVPTRGSRYGIASGLAVDLWAPGAWPMVRAKVSMKALGVAQPHRCAVSMTLAPSAS